VTAPTTPNLGLKKTDRSSPTTTYFNLQDHDDNWDKIDGKFDPTVGHKHTGAAGDGPQITSAGLAAGAATDTVIGNRTVDDTATPNTGPNTITNLFSFFGKMIKLITGESSWVTFPVISLRAIYNRLLATPSQSTTNTTYYVNAATGNDSYDGLTAGTAFKTIGKAISMIPQILNHNYTINVAAGTYNEDVVISGICGSGSITINGDSVVSTTRTVNSITVNNVNVFVTVTGFNLVTTTANSLTVSYSVQATFTSMNIVQNALSYSGLWAYSSNVSVINSVISNKANALWSLNSRVYATGNTGTGNTVVYYASQAGWIGWSGTMPSGTTSFTMTNAGSITSGVINPWGDNTTANRSRVYAVSNATQNISASTNTKVLFQTVAIDNLGEFSSSKLTAKSVATYDIKGVIAFSSGMGSSVSYTISIYKNGVAVRTTKSDAASSSPSPVIPFSGTIDVSAGDYIEIYVNTSVATVLAAGSTLDITRIA
jgi:hypothetical protein